MPYFRNEKVNLLFIHIPKTGGSSLQKYFSRKYDIILDNKSLFTNLDKTIKKENNIEIYSSLQHITYQTIFRYKDFFNINEKDLDIISIVRNPYERIISDLFFYNKIRRETSKSEVFDIIKNYLFFESIEILDNHNIPQYVFITDENKNLIHNIKILHTETLKEDMINLGYTDFDIKIITNVYGKLNYYDYLNNDSIELVNDFFHYDFTLFNYPKIIV